MAKMGACSKLIIGYRLMRLWIMLSSSRAYPMKLEEKTSSYRRLMQTEGITEHDYGHPNFLILPLFL